MSKAKQNALLLLSTVWILILLLAMSLPNLVFAPGQPFSLGQPQAQAAGGDGELPGGGLLVALFQGVLALSVVLFPVYVVYSLLTRAGRERLLADIIVIAFFVLLASLLRNNGAAQNVQPTPQIGVPPPNLAAGSDLPTAHFPATPPPWLTLVVILAVSVLAMIAILVVIWFFRRRVKTPNPALKKLGEEAQSAIEAMQAGGDFGTTVIQCYQAMNWVVKKEKGLSRETSTTPREFEDWLINKGLPEESVKVLTRLFEQVRYGNRLTGEPEEHLALSCLTAIVNACQGAGAKNEI